MFCLCIYFVFSLVYQFELTWLVLPTIFMLANLATMRGLFFSLLGYEQLPPTFYISVSCLFSVTFGRNLKAMFGTVQVAMKKKIGLLGHMILLL